MSRLYALPLAILVACDATPSDPSLSLPQASEVAPTTVLVPPQLVDLELTGGGRRPAQVQGHMILTTRDNAVPMDGAILVVSAADGPMPSLPPGTWAQVVFYFESGSIDPAGAVTLAGRATLRYPDGSRVSDLVTASAQLPADCGTCDEIIWDILGGNVWDAAAAPSRFSLTIVSNRD